MKLEKNKDRR